MADENIGEIEYGRMPYIGPSPGSVEFGRLPAVGSACALVVQSSPAVGAAIAVTPADLFELDDGTTNFVRYYDLGTVVLLTAPAILGADPFSKWTVDGADQVGNPINVTMDTDRVAIAVYAPIPPVAPVPGIEMLKVMIPKFKYWKSAPAGEISYPNLEDGAEGKTIPEAYGVLTNITPVCIDTVNGKYKLARRAIKAIDAIRDGGRALAVGTDYLEDLVNAEFTFLTTPLLTGGATYYFALESDYAIDGANYLKFGWDDYWSQANYCYSIDGSGVWAEHSGNNMIFEILGRSTFGGTEESLVVATEFNNWNGLFYLRDAAARTRRGQKFTMPAGGPWYVSRICFYYAGMVGTVSPSANTRVQVLSAISPAELTVGMKSNRLEDGGYAQAWYPQRASGSNELGCDIQGLKNADTSLMENVADVLKDIYVNILGGSAAGINAGDLAALKLARVQDVARYMSEAKEFQQSLEIFEASHLFKFLPSLGGDFAVRYFASGAVGAPHLKEQHIKNFKTRRIWTNVFQVTKVKYYQDPSTGDWLVAEEKSDIAQYLYNRQDSIEIETALKDAADAVQLAKDYLGTDGASTRRIHLQYPMRLAEFDVLAGYGDLLIPTMKVQLTLPRADYTGGILNGILFRILEVSKNPENGESHILSVLDEMTY